MMPDSFWECYRIFRDNYGPLGSLYRAFRTWLHWAE